MYHPVHGTARLTKSTHYCCQLLALPLNINGQQQCINLENTNIGYIWRTSAIRTDTKLACVAALPVCRSYQSLAHRWKAGLPLVPAIQHPCKVYQVLSSNLSQPSPEYLGWQGGYTKLWRNNTGSHCTLMSKLTISYFLQRSQMWHPVRLALIFAAKYTQVEALYTYIILFETFIGSSKYEMATRQLWGSQTKYFLQSRIGHNVKPVAGCAGVLPPPFSPFPPWP